MMRFSPLFLAVLFVFCLAGRMQAQNSSRADKLFDKFNYAEALEEYLFLHGKDSAFVHAQRQIGICLRKLGQLDASATWFEAVLTTEEATPLDKLHYAEALKAGGDYSGAVFWYGRYAAEVPEDRRASYHLETRGYHNSLLADSLRYEVKVLAINGEHPSFGMGKYGDSYLFSSAGTIDYAGDQNNYSELVYLDIYSCQIDAEGEAFDALPLEGVVNCKFHDGPACFDPLSGLMYVTRNNMKGGKPVYDKSGTANLKIYTFQELSGIWQEGPELPFNSEEYSAGHPSVAHDGSYMVFVSNMPGGYGGTDLYISYASEEGWSEPENLGPTFNTEGNEMFPYISESELLYFSSDGFAGLGGMDIFVGPLKGAPKDFRPMNLGAPINSRADDFGILIDEANETGHFSSNRGEKGIDKLYHFKQKTFSHQIVAGMLTSDESVSFASRFLTLKNMSTLRDTVVRLDQTGSFRALLAAGNDYELYLGAPSESNRVAVGSIEMEEKLLETYRYAGTFKVEREPLLAAGFIRERTLQLSVPEHGMAGDKIRDRLAELRDKAKLLSDEEFDAFNTMNLMDESELDWAVSAQEAVSAGLNQTLVEQKLNNLNFGFDSHSIRSAERKKITALAELMRESPESEVVIKAHTDSRGDENYNLLLSMRRAKSVRQALIDRGIEAERIRIAWLGASELLVDCTSQPCTAADHALNRRAEIVVISANKQAEAVGQ